MFELYLVYDASFPGHRVMFSSAEQALAYHKGVVAKYGSAPNVEHHWFPDSASLIAFLTEDLREYQGIDLETFDDDRSQ
jgi:hypothetical protein